MNAIVNKFLLAGDKFMPEMQLKQPTSVNKLGFRYSACEPFTKNKRKNTKIKKTQEIQDISTEMNQIKLAFNMI